MTIDQFTLQDFEKFLEDHKPYDPLGLIDGEYSYRLPLDGQSAIMLRSSVGADGLAKKSGKDSIRLWLVSNDDKPIGSKLDSWTARVNGWQQRLFDKIYELTNRRMLAGDCRECGKPLGIYKRKSDKKLFVKCFSCSKRLRKNINGNLSNPGWFSPASQMKRNSNENLQEKQRRDESGKSDMQELPKNVLDEFLSSPFGEDEPEKEFAPNEKQKQAIEMPVDANVRVFAGPGAGKTFIIKHRVKQLISQGVNPKKILVITYSKPMADEMGEKILTLSPDAVKEQISTIHAFCYRELTRNNQELKYFGWQVPGKFAPLKSWQIKAKIEDLVSSIWPSREKPGYKEVLDWIDTSKYHNATNNQWFSDCLGSFFGSNLAKIRTGFDKYLHSHHCMTFADMLYLMEQELISNADFKAKMQGKYSHVIVDEGQDTNYQAFRIFYHLFENGAKLFLVGDVNQMLYRFQGAKPDLITDEIDKVLPDIQTVILENNHRSHNEIIDHFQRLIAFNYSDKNGPYDQKFFQEVKGVKGIGGSVRFSMASDVFDESVQIAGEINALYDGGYKAGQIFVGARTKAQLGYLEGELLKAGIKFINIAGGSFWDSRDVKNVISYLRLAQNTQDKVAFEQVHNIASAENIHPHWHKQRAGEYCPTRFLGKKFLAAVDFNYENTDTVYRAGRYGWRKRTYEDMTEGQEDLLYFVDTLISQVVTTEDVGQIVRWIIDNCYEQYLKAEGNDSEDENSKLDNLTTVIDIAAQYTKVEDFLACVDEMMQAAQDAKDKDWGEYVVIGTYHRLKGLEREVIFGMGWCEGSHSKTGDPVGLLPHTFSLVDPPQFGILPVGSKAPIEDERCIGFVCISRAIEKVYLSGCAEYRGHKMWPSRFIEEMDMVNNDE